MTPTRLATALRAQAQGLYCLEATAELLISHASFLCRSDFAEQFIRLATSLTDGVTEMAAIDWPAAIAALNTGPQPTEWLSPHARKPALTVEGWRATMETKIVFSVSDGRRAEVIVDAASRLFLAPGPGRVSMDDLARALGMSKKTIYLHFPDKHSLMTAVLDQQFGAIERTLVAAVEHSQDKPFGERIQRFLIAACSELGRIGAAQLATGRGDAVLRRHVEQRIDTVVYRRLDELFRDGHRRGLLSAPPELLGEITRSAVERLLNSQLPRELNCTAADLLRATVDTVLYGAIRSGGEGEQEVGS